MIQITGSAMVCAAFWFTPLVEAQVDLSPVATPAVQAMATPDQQETPDLSLRMKLYLRKLASPQAVYETFPGAISDHLRNFPKQWGRGWSGFADRTGSQYGQFVVSTSIETFVQAIHKEDPRYFRSQEAGVWHRTRYALVNSFLVRKPAGGRTFAYSLPAGVYGSWFVATRWSPPDLQTPWSILQWGSIGMGIKVSANVFREFWPDVRQHVFHKHS